MTNKYDISARYTATGARVLNMAERETEKQRRVRSVAKMTRENVKDRLFYHKQSQEEVIAFLMKVEGFEEKDAIALVKKIAASR